VFVTYLDVASALETTRIRSDALKPVSFEMFFEREYPRLVRALSANTVSLSEAEDLAQEAMVRVYERWQRVSELQAPAAYVYTIAVNLYRRRRRRRATFPWKRLAAGRGDRDQEDPVAQLALHDQLFAALAGLPEGQRDVVLLVDWFDLDSTSAAEVLGIEPPSVRSQLHRARRALQDVLGKEIGRPWT
jgi:RNA polymerase sigma factor (sigma-70 family)